MGTAPMTRAEAIEALQDQLNEMLFEADEYRHRAREIELDAEWLADVLDGLRSEDAPQQIAPGQTTSSWDSGASTAGPDYNWLSDDHDLGF